MTNQNYPSGQQIVSAIPSFKKAIEDVASLLKKPENKNLQDLEIINKFLTNGVKLNEEIKSGKLKEIDLASLRASEKLVFPLIPAAALRNHSRGLIEEIRNSITSVNQKSTNANGESMDELVMLISILLLALNIPQRHSEIQSSI